MAKISVFPYKIGSQIYLGKIFPLNRRILIFCGMRNYREHWLPLEENAPPRGALPFSDPKELRRFLNNHLRYLMECWQDQPPEEMEEP